MQLQEKHRPCEQRIVLSYYVSYSAVYFGLSSCFSSFRTEVARTFARRINCLQRKLSGNILRFFGISFAYKSANKHWQPAHGFCGKHFRISTLFYVVNGRVRMIKLFKTKAIALCSSCFLNEDSQWRMNLLTIIFYSKRKFISFTAMLPRNLLFIISSGIGSMFFLKHLHQLFSTIQFVQLLIAISQKYL